MIVAVFGAAGALWWSRTSSSSSEADRGLPLLPAPESATKEDVPTDPLPQESLALLGRVQPTADVDSPSTFTGTVVHLHEPDIGRQTGSIHVAFLDDSAPAFPFVLAVEKGTWSVQAPAGKTLALYPAELGGRKYWPKQRTLDLIQDTALTIELLSGPLVRVIDSNTGLELDLVSVLPYRNSDPSLLDGILAHTGKFGPTTIPPPRDAPIPVSELRESSAYLLTAEGTTWGAAPVGGRPASVQVLVDPAGELLVQVASGGELLSPRCSLALFPPEPETRPRALYRIPFSESRAEYTLEKVRAGKYRAEVVRDAGSENESSLFSAALEIRRGAQALLSLDLVDRDAGVDPTAVSFLITGEDEALAQIEAISVRPERVRGLDSESYTWLRAADVATSVPGALEYRPVSLAPGTYLLELRPLGRVERITLPEAPSHVAEIVLPGLWDYMLRVTDLEGRDVELATLQMASSDMDEGARIGCLPSGARGSMSSVPWPCPWFAVDSSCASRLLDS